jgi:hypothetical protein
MLVFISWSGEASKTMAEGLKAFLQLTLGRCTPWVSSVDIEAGTKWTEELRAKIKNAGYCVVCVTSENATKPWINYEVGAIREGFEKRTSPWLLDIRPEQLEKLPLSSVQGTSTSREDTYKMIVEINQLLAEPHPATVIDQQFEAHWTGLSKSLADAKLKVTTPTVEKRKLEDVLKELVLNTRTLLERLPEPVEIALARHASITWGTGLDVADIGPNVDPRVAEWIRHLLKVSGREIIPLAEVETHCDQMAYAERLPATTVSVLSPRFEHAATCGLIPIPRMCGSDGRGELVLVPERERLFPRRDLLRGTRHGLPRGLPAERYFHAALLVYTGYKPKTHDLQTLANQTAPLHPELDGAGPRTDP